MPPVTPALHRYLPRAFIQKPASAGAFLIPCPLAIAKSKSTLTYHKQVKDASAFRDGIKQSEALNFDSSSLSRMKASALLRNIFLGFVFTSPTLLKMTLPTIDLIAKSNSVFLNPDRNPVLRAVLKPTVYAQFCAGANDQEIAKTRNEITAMGFSGTVLCFGKEIQMTKEKGIVNTGRQQDATEVAYWRDGNLETLDMARDWIGIKLTGAGLGVMQALMDQKELPREFEEAMTDICERAKDRKCKIWIDSEQQAVQPGIDKVTIDLMRRYNRDGHALVYNTLQSYLKASRDKLKHQLSLSHQEGWQLAIKLVRGAYIANDERSLIHDTKQDTDVSYDCIIRDILQGTNLGFHTDEFPRMQLLIAGHNPSSVINAFQLSRKLYEQGRLRVRPDFAQLQGMADELGCELLRRCEEVRKHTPDAENACIPHVYKCLTWGSVRECIQYLLRRMVENRGASDRIRDGLGAYMRELQRRIIRK